MTKVSMCSNIGRWFNTAIMLVLLLIPAWMAYAEEDHDTARQLLQSGDILPLEKILAKVRETQPGKVLEVELEKKAGHVIYEIEILGEDGVVRELYVDAATAEVLKTKIDD